MDQQVTLTVSENVWLYAKTVAAQSKRRVEEVLSEWLDRISSEIDVEKLSDAEILALTKLKLSPGQQKMLDELQEKNGEGELSDAETKQLDELMAIYEDALLRKSQALRAAVERGLIPPLSSE
jgi:ABC-type siderophore export system fused ATPase/permease subunit